MVQRATATCAKFRFHPRWSRGEEGAGVDAQACTHLIDLAAFLEIGPVFDELLLGGHELLFQLLRLLGHEHFVFTR